MTNIFEQPWLLLIASAVVLLGVFVFTSIMPERRRWWLWLLPAIVAAAALGIDYLAATDTEKVRAVIAKVVKAAQNEDCEGIEPFISEAYGDSFHKSKLVLMAHCRSRLSESVIEKNVLRIISTDVKPPNATAVFTVRVVFDPQGPIYEYSKMMVFKLEAQFRKENDKWLFTRVEVLEVNLQPADWQHIQ